jgi:hypothetical protein
MLRRFASITRQGSRVKADILPGVRSVASGHSLMFPRKRHPKVKVSPDQHSTGHWDANGNTADNKGRRGTGPFLKFFAYGRRSVVKIYTGK